MKGKKMKRLRMMLIINKSQSSRIERQFRLKYMENTTRRKISRLE